MPERVEHESDIALSDIGALARVEVNGTASVLRLRSLVECPDALMVLWPHITAILDPVALTERLLAPATAVEGEPMPETQSEPMTEDEYIRDSVQAERDRERAASKARDAELNVRHESILRQYTEAELRSFRESAERTWRLWTSPKRIARERAVIENRKPLTAVLAALQTHLPHAIKAAQQAAEERVRAEYSARAAETTRRFERGAKNWREAAE